MFQLRLLDSMTFPGLENEILKFHDFPGFPWPARTHSNVLHWLWLQTKQDTTWGRCGQGKFLLERKGFAIRERGTVCIFHAKSCLSFFFFFFFFFFYQLRPTHLCEGHRKSVSLLLWAQKGAIGKTSHRKIKKKNRSQDRYDRRGESARWVQTYDFL